MHKTPIYINNMQPNKMISSHSREMSGSQDSNRANSVHKQSQGFNMYTCACQLHVKSFQAAIKFPCVYFVQVRDDSNRKSIHKGSKRVTPEQSLSTFDEVMNFEIDMLYDQTRNQFKKRQILLVLNLESTRRPNYPKFVGKITVDLADVHNSSSFSEQGTYQLECCSVEANITFHVKIVEKVLSKSSSLQPQADDLSSSLKHENGSQSAVRGDTQSEQPCSIKKQELINDNQVLDEEVRKLQMLCESIEKKRSQESCQYERVIQNLESKIQSHIETENQNAHKMKAMECRITDLKAELKILREVARNSFIDESLGTEKERIGSQATCSIVSDQEAGQNPNMNSVLKTADHQQTLNFEQSETVEYWKQMFKNQKEQFELEMFKLNKLLECSNEQLSANKQIVAKMYEWRQKSRQLLGVLQPEGQSSKPQYQPPQSSLQDRSESELKDLEIVRLTDRVEELQEQLFRQLSCENTKQLKIQYLQQELNDFRAVLVMSNEASPPRNGEEASPGNHSRTDPERQALEEIELEKITSSEQSKQKLIRQYESRIQQIETCWTRTQKELQNLQHQLSEQINELANKERAQQERIDCLRQQLMQAHSQLSEKETVITRLNAQIKELQAPQPQICSAGKQQANNKRVQGGLGIDDVSNQTEPCETRAELNYYSEELQLFTVKYEELETEHSRLEHKYSELLEQTQLLEEELKLARHTLAQSHSESENLKQQLEHQNSQLKSKTRELQSAGQEVTASLESENLKNELQRQTKAHGKEQEDTLEQSVEASCKPSNQDIVTAAAMLKQLLVSRPHEGTTTQALLSEITQLEQHVYHSAGSSNKLKSSLLEKCRGVSLQLSKAKKQIVKNNNILLAEKASLLSIFKPFQCGIRDIVDSAGAYCDDDSIREDQTLDI